MGTLRFFKTPQKCLPVLKNATWAKLAVGFASLFCRPAAPSRASPKHHLEALAEAQEHAAQRYEDLAGQKAWLRATSWLQTYTCPLVSAASLKLRGRDCMSHPSLRKRQFCLTGLPIQDTVPTFGNQLRRVSPEWSRGHSPSARKSPAPQGAYIPNEHVQSLEMPRPNMHLTNTLLPRTMGSLSARRLDG